LFFDISFTYKTTNMKKITLLSLFFWSTLAVVAQSVGPATINAASGQAVLNGNTYEYSFGELSNTQTMTSNNLVVTHGVLQPFYFATDAINEFSELSNLFSIVPTIGQGQFNLSVSIENSGEIIYYVYSTTGQLIQKKNLEKNTGNGIFVIDLHSAAAAEYFVLVTFKANQQTKYNSFKIQKK
jgi:hypothetical protein